MRGLPLWRKTGNEAKGNGYKSTGMRIVFAERKREATMYLDERIGVYDTTNDWLELSQ